VQKLLINVSLQPWNCGYDLTQTMQFPTLACLACSHNDGSSVIAQLPCVLAAGSPIMINITVSSTVADVAAMVAQRVMNKRSI
jgi:hypothetical protein